MSKKKISIAVGVSWVLGINWCCENQRSGTKDMEYFKNSEGNLSFLLQHLSNTLRFSENLRGIGGGMQVATGRGGSVGS